MTGPKGNILLLADGSDADVLGSLPWPGELSLRRHPYDALEELANRAYEAVVLTYPRADFEGLVRAARRLQGSAGVYALCRPAGEADLQMTPPPGLTDYFLLPPSEHDLSQMVTPARRRPAGEAGESALLTPQEVADLVESAGSVETLSRQALRCVEEWTGLKVGWSECADEKEEPSALLLLDADPPRVLVLPAGQTPLPSQRRKIEALQVLLGPLAGNARRTEALHRLAITDHLTGAFNRRYLYHFTDQLLGRAKAERFRATLLLYDIDDFKRYNDTYGHAAGDEILREMAGLMKQVTRGHDLVARIGGDEFTILFWDAEPPRRPDSRHPDTAYALAERLVRALARHEFPSLGPEAKGVLTISGGLATFPWDGSTCRELLRHADAALRQAKASGKNAIYLIGSEGGVNVTARKHPK